MDNNITNNDEKHVLMSNGTNGKRSLRFIGIRRVGWALVTIYLLALTPPVYKLWMGVLLRSTSSNFKTEFSSARPSSLISPLSPEIEGFTVTSIQTGQVVFEAPIVEVGSQNVEIKTGKIYLEPARYGISDVQEVSNEISTLLTVLPKNNGPTTLLVNQVKIVNQTNSFASKMNMTASGKTLIKASRITFDYVLSGDFKGRFTGEANVVEKEIQSEFKIEGDYQGAANLSVPVKITTSSENLSLFKIERTVAMVPLPAATLIDLTTLKDPLLNPIEGNSFNLDSLFRTYKVQVN